jgi:hypothetical protein
MFVQLIGPSLRGAAGMRLARAGHGVSRESLVSSAGETKRGLKALID